MASIKPPLRLSNPTNQVSEPSQKKKRAKSLGGAFVHNRGSHESHTEPIELTPRKKARRSLLPGKSILKSRPTVIGLERSNTDSLMRNIPTIPLKHTLSLPTDLKALSAQANSSEAQQRSILARTDSQLAQDVKANPRPDVDETDSNASSDMEISSRNAISRRVSAASNTTSNFRRVSFAPKAHVRTFGSPLREPGSSSPPTSSRSHGDDENTADMSIDDDASASKASPPTISSVSGPSGGSLSAHPPSSSASGSTSNSAPASSSPASKHGTNIFGGTKQLESLGFGPAVAPGLPKLSHQPHKPSRLSNVFTGLDHTDLDDDDEEMEMDEGDSSLALSPSQLALPPSLPLPPRAFIREPELQPGASTESPPPFPKSPNSVRSPTRKEPPLPMDINSPPPPAPIPHSAQRPSQIPRLSSYNTNTGTAREPMRRKSSAADLLKRLKSTRPSLAFPTHAGEETGEVEGVGHHVGQPQVQSAWSPSAPSPPPSTVTMDNAQNNAHSTVDSHRPSLAPPPALSFSSISTESVSKTTVPSQKKSSRLTLAFPEYGHGDDTVTTEFSKADHQTGHAHSSKPSRLTMSIFPEYADDAEDVDQRPSDSQDTEPNQIAAHGAGGISSKSSRLTMSVFPEYADDVESRPSSGVQDTVLNEDQGGRKGVAGMSSKPSRLTMSVFPEYANDDIESRTSTSSQEPGSIKKAMDQKKSSRLTFALPGLEEDAELDETMDLDDPFTSLGPAPTAEKPPSGLSEFFAAADNGSQLMDENESADLIDLDDFSLDNPPPSTTATSKAQMAAPDPTPDLSAVTKELAKDAQPLPMPLPPALPLAPLLLHRRTSASPSRRPSSERSGHKFPPPRRSTDTSTIEPPLPPPSAAAVAAKSRRSSFLITPSLPSPARRLPSPSPPSPRPSAPPPPAFTLQEFFQQAELRFINLAQPRVRGTDETGPLGPPTGQMAGLGDQVFAGMVKVPRLRMLETAGRTLRLKTENLDEIISDRGTNLESNPQQSSILSRWMQLQQQRKNPPQQQQSEELLTGLLERLRLEKTGAELRAKKEGLEFEARNLEAFRVGLSERRARLSRDLKLMKSVDEVVRPSIQSLRDHKAKLIEEIRKRKLKNEEIEKCDQGLLEALKAETKDLGMAVEAMRGTLNESEFEKNIWRNKVEALDDEKKELARMIEQWARRGDEKGDECTTQDLVRMKNEFVALQRMVGWEMVRFDHDRLEFVHRTQVGVIFSLEPARGLENEHRKVGRVELRWIDNTLGLPPDHDRDLVETIDRFFFGRLGDKYRDRSFQAGGRVKDYVHQISSIWYLARELRYEFLNIKRCFRIDVKVDEIRHLMSVRTRLNGRGVRERAGIELVFELRGEEILEFKSPAVNVVAGVGCRVVGSYGKADTQALTYVAREAIDQASGRGALKKACEEALKTLENGIA